MRKSRRFLAVLLFPVLAVVFLAGWVIAYFAEKQQPTRRRLHEKSQRMA